MHSLDNPLVMREIIMDHYKNPRNHGIVNDDSYMKTNMNSSTCIDNIDAYIASKPKPFGELVINKYKDLLA